MKMLFVQQIIFQKLKLLTVDEINVLDLLKHDKLIITKDAAEKAGEVLA